MNKILSVILILILFILYINVPSILYYLNSVIFKKDDKKDLDANMFLLTKIAAFYLIINIIILYYLQKYKNFYILNIISFLLLCTWFLIKVLIFDKDKIVVFFKYYLGLIIANTFISHNIFNLILLHKNAVLIIGDLLYFINLSY